MLEFVQENFEYQLGTYGTRNIIVIDKTSSTDSFYPRNSKKIKKNPYILTKINGFGFKRVDDIALKVNPSLRQSSERCVAAITYILEAEAYDNGNTWILYEDLLERTRELVPECGTIFKNFIQSRKTSTSKFFTKPFPSIKLH